MPEVAKTKRIFQIAKELNISHVEILKYLNDKGEGIASHMSPVSPEIYDEILLEFSKDKQQSERYRKEQARKRVVSDIRKKHTALPPEPKKHLIKTIDAVIKEDSFTLSDKIKQASEKLKKTKNDLKLFKATEDRIVDDDSEASTKITSDVKSKRQPAKNNLIKTDPSSSLLEIPLSSIIIEKPIASTIRQYLTRGLNLHRLLNRFTSNPHILRPNGQNLNKMVKILDYALQYNFPCVEFMLHSSELMPGGSPYFTDKDSIEKLYNDIEILFQSASKRFKGVTCKEFYFIFFKSK